MLKSASTNRLQQLIKILNGVRSDVVQFNSLRAYVTSENVAIGEIVKDIEKSEKPELVPRLYYKENLPQTTIHHLKWIMQKDLLGQDIFLIGPPGPRKRVLAMQYLELTNREHEYVALSRDTTESDLKQRREIVGGTAKYFDQSAVKAAMKGRVLILEGVEKAERNVLPVLNNLLENREMHLEDGRLLIPAERYDKLLEKHGFHELEKWKLVRVDENFRVIALGLPVPRYRGNPLDPPLRSRFQARDVSNFTYQEWYRELTNKYTNAPKEKLEKLLSCAFALLNQDSKFLGLPDFPVDNLPAVAEILDKNPELPIYDLFYRLYPYKTFLSDSVSNIESLLNTFIDIPVAENSSEATLATQIKEFVTAKLPKQTNPSEGYIQTLYQNKILQQMLQTGQTTDFCLIGPSGSGKTMLLKQMAAIQNKDIENIVLYQDMTSRDLLQQRTTLENGDTVWSFSPLVKAALNGKIAVLDGINRIHPSTLSVLHRLVQDRELQLYDGKRLISLERFDFLQNKLNLTKNQLTESGIFPVHSDFRIVAVGDPPNIQSKEGNWMSPEMLSLFVFHDLRTLSKIEEIHVISSKFGRIDKTLHKIIDLAHILRSNNDQSLKNLAGHLSTRQLIRIAARMKQFHTEDAYSMLEETFMLKFLPAITKKSLEKLILNVGIAPSEDFLERNEKNIRCEVVDGILTIGNTSVPVYQTEHLTKVPKVLFYDIPQHVKLMEGLLQDFQLGYHLLLVGNQGVGKNKIVDRFLELLNRPREYIQLHRDTTVQTLTTQPTVKDGVLIYEDSPLVKAIKHGHVLVVDEADKAPTHVTCILKTLVESGQMILSDGRRIVLDIPDVIGEDEYIQIHPDFRMIVLANRPGFPFLGNDFFGALGDLFSSRAVENPSRQSEIELLRSYGPNVPIKTIRKLVDIFGELRNMADQGLLNYPYSTREVVNIVKHLQKFPNADVEDVVFNVFDFDRYSPELLETLGEVLERHGFSKNVMTAEYIAAKRAQEKIQVTVNRKSGLDVSSPKHGKEDPNNDPHVGGNTWAGGTGGRDTAGLGGKGGPYRLDKGHTVHQLSDEEKASVPEHVQKAAREMNRKAYADKLKQIGMTPYDHDVYSQFSNAVARQVQALRVILGNLQAKNKERNWYRHQTTGELDDVKLIDGLLGEKTIFRRRAEQEPEIGTPQLKPKYFRILADVSGSMYRFNGYDGRLDRELEAVVLVMEALEGFEDKIKYDIIGHSGEEYNINFVSRDNPPKNNKHRLEVIRKMHAHAQFCWSGDNTLQSTTWGVSTLAEEDCDEAILVLLSDANLQRYGISPARLAEALTMKPTVSSYAVFIGGLGDQAERLTQKLPSGRAFICNDTKELPQILKQIFWSSVNV
ncbi:LOW QUALITY PROTEIN: von Willebrand factor A domain-containing protein 8 [Anthonomus grandis grandis]|uniref:LOW QUALITY PROTEIN: von Willebrand factor A domain-containing protein 8 n=1 Tax=Anthonomus grandis grandis TaxID=2921223 RepID=UPI0021652D20|nr:LOW QUALITY PROTEIN: von Willebrand factor A domain-containing protein 8 [Anthonomus grandis grandis]